MMRYSEEEELIYSCDRRFAEWWRCKDPQLFEVAGSMTGERFYVHSVWVTAAWEAAVRLTIEELRKKGCCREET
jgi:hypothetical protein